MFTFINSIYIKLEQFISGYETFYWQIFIISVFCLFKPQVTVWKKTITEPLKEGVKLLKMFPKCLIPPSPYVNENSTEPKICVEVVITSTACICIVWLYFPHSASLCKDCK